MTKLSIFIVILCALAVLVNVAVAGNYGRQYYNDDGEEGNSEIYKLQEEIRRLRENERHRSYDRGYHQSYDGESNKSGNQLGSLFELPLHILQKPFGMLGGH